MSPEPAAPSHRSRAACLCGRQPARPAHRLGSGSSAPLGPRQSLDQCGYRRAINRPSNPHPPASRNLDLDRACANRRRCRHRVCSSRDRYRRKHRGRWRGATELAPPAKQLAGINASRSGYLGCNRARLDRRRNDPLLLRPRPAPAAFHRRDHLNFCLRHRAIPRINPMTSSSTPYAQGGLHRVDTVIATGDVER